MSEETKPEVTEIQEPQEPELSNSDVKKHPLFQKLTEQLGQFQREAAERAAAEEKAAREHEMKKAEEEQRWQDALRMREQELEETKAKYEKDMRDRDLAFELSRAGFNNDVFIKGAMASYNPDAGSIGEYVQNLANDEANKVFLGNQQAPRANPPSTPSVTGGSFTTEQLRAMRDSDDPEVRAKRRAYLKSLYKAGKPLPSE